MHRRAPRTESKPKDRTLALEFHSFELDHDSAVRRVPATERFDANLITMRALHRSLVAIVVIPFFLQRGLAGDVFVAAASSMSPAVREIIAVFERETGHRVRLSLGSSGNFYGQITNGAPFDVFLSADRDYVDRLDRDGLVESGSLATYALGRLVVWARADSGLRPGTDRMDTLLNATAGRVAIANPRLAPYGRAAIEAMDAFGVHDRVASKIIQGENISQAAQFVSSGAADVGILALSLARSDAMQDGVYWLIPVEAHTPIAQGMAILSRAQSEGRYPQAEAFWNTVRGSEGRAILEKYGFSVP